MANLPRSGWPRSALEGGSLEEVLARERVLGHPPRSVDAAVALLHPVAEALELSHVQGVWHLDLAPRAIAIVGGRARLLVRSAVARAQTPHRSYGAAEQFCEAYGLPGPWTDVFALALVLVELVTLTRYLETIAPAEIGRVAAESFRRLRASTRAAGADDPVGAVIARALALFPAERFQTAGSFWRALSLALTRDSDGSAWHIDRTCPDAWRRR